jgi:hypothetical protein
LSGFLCIYFLVLFQAAKKIYENLLGDDDNATALAHIQVCECFLFNMLNSSSSSVGYFENQ